MDHELPLERIAVRIRRSLPDPTSAWLDQVERSLVVICQDLAFIDAVRGRMRKAIERRWFSAARHLLRELPYRLRGLRDEFIRCDDLLGRYPRTPLSLRQIHEDLVQIHDEFGQLSFHATDQTLAVETDPITLERVYLGPFRILIRLDRLASGISEAAIEVVAVDPHPAAGNGRVPHPHVSDGRLCAGEASGPLAAALQDGRICDAFLLVRSVLETYNPESPHVALDQWNAEPCRECGHTAGDDLCFCDGCEQDFCNDCTESCCHCSAPRCSGCLENCAFCHESFCDGCFAECAACHQRCCETCMVEKRCPHCNEKEIDHEKPGKQDKDKQPKTAQPTEPAPASRTSQAA